MQDYKKGAALVWVLEGDRGTPQTTVTITNVLRPADRPIVIVSAHPNILNARNALNGDGQAGLLAGIEASAHPLPSGFGHAVDQTDSGYFIISCSQLPAQRGGDLQPGYHQDRLPIVLSRCVSISCMYCCTIMNLMSLNPRSATSMKHRRV